MLDAALRQIARLGGAKKKKKARSNDPQPRVLDARGIDPDAPAAEPGPGFTAAPAPIGFADPFDAFPDASPRPRLDTRPATALHAPFDVPLDQAVADRAAPSKKAKRNDSRLPERQPAVVAARAGVLRDRMQDNVDDVKKAMEKPELGATMGQRVLGEEAARAAKRGDRQGLRQALAGLVQKLDVSSPKDAVVLIKQEAGLQAGGQVQALLGQGKATLDGTPGGRILSKISPMIRDYAPADMKGEVDGAWNGLAEKFVTGAKGKVDVVLGVAPSGAAQEAAAAGLDSTHAAATGGPRDLAGPALPGGLGVGEVGGAAPAAPGGAAGSLAGGPGGSGGGMAISVGEMDAGSPGAVSFASGPGAGAPGSGVGEVSAGGSAGTGGGAAGRAPIAVGESTSASQSIAMTPGLPPTGASMVTVGEMSADSARGVTVQPGVPSTPGTLNVQAVGEMSADTAQQTAVSQATVKQAGRSVVAGQMTLQDVLQRNPEISEVRLQQVEQTPKGGALKSLGSLARNALLQRLQGGGGIGGGSSD